MYKKVNELLGTGYESDLEISWNYLSSFQSLSESFIREFKDKVDWFWISSDQKLSESFIREFKDKVCWGRISYNQILSEDFIKEFKDFVNWNNISLSQILSESFIREFKDYVDWKSVSYSQILSWNFMLEFENYIDWGIVSLYQPFINPNYEKINKKFLKENKLYHLYQETKERGWFLGYINIKKNLIKFIVNPNHDFYLNIKSRIYWKDLLTLDTVFKYEKFNRQTKYL